MSERPLGPRTRVLLAAALTAAFVGLFIGIRPRPLPPITAPSVPSEQGEVVAGVPHRALPARTHGELADRPWSSRLEPWRPSSPTPPPVTTQDAAAKQAAIASLAEHRAFSGAPPTIPHPVRQGSAVECRACHERGARIGEVLAPPMSHPLYGVCTQCHVPEASPIPGRGEGLTVVNTFEGTRAAPAPYRWSAAPPQIPHRSWMRERCDACHGVHGRPGLQTSHPERQSCTQCHAPSAELEQHAARGLEP